MKLGKYEIQSELGKGGFGQVLLALDSQIGRRVAIKVIRAGIDANSDIGREFLLRFRAEAATTAALRHPNIVTVYEFGEHEGSPPYPVISSQCATGECHRSCGAR